MFVISTILLLLPISSVGTTVASPPPPIPGDLIPIPGTGTPIGPAPAPIQTVPISPPVSIYSIDRIKSGLIGSDSLTDETLTKEQLLANPRYWSYDGSAVAQNAPFDLFKNSQGLFIGVKAVSNGNWAGYFAVTPNTDAALFHSVITTPVRTIASNFYENGLYVQTSNGLINYVTCVSVTSSFGTVWAVASAMGDINQATQFKVYWVDTSPNQPLTRDCTIITNGNNYLKVYLDNVLVYESNNLDLQMPPPFNAFLEPQTSYAGQMLDGTYKDYYATSDENIKVTNNPPLADSVKLVDPAGKVIASAPVVSGTAILDIGKNHMPLNAYIKVYSSTNIQLSSTKSPENMYGGDAYSVNLNPGL